MQDPGRVPREVETAGECRRLADTDIKEAGEVEPGRADDCQRPLGMAVGQAGVNGGHRYDLLHMDVAVKTGEGGGCLGETAARLAGLTGQGRQESEAHGPKRLCAFGLELRTGRQLTLAGPPRLCPLAGVNGSHQHRRASAFLQGRGL
jgi:hypothetical protein